MEDERVVVSSAWRMSTVTFYSCFLFQTTEHFREELLVHL